MMQWYVLSLVTMFVFIVYFMVLGNVGRARYKFGIKAPAMTGHADFERYVRVHYNTMEQMVVLLPAMWFFAYFVDSTWAAVLGVVWCIGRIIYAFTYYKGAEKRHLGSAISFVPTIVFVIGTIISLVVRIAS